MKMNEIDERIKYNKKAVESLRRCRELGDFSKFSESELATIEQILTEQPAIDWNAGRS